jgi:hypothetical protein
MLKEKSNEFEKRILRTISCPQNKYIPRVDDAGKIFLPEPGYQLMHNGLKVEIDGYYGEYKSNGRGFVTDMLIRNKGVHEPQEERMFQEVLKYIPDNGSMLELGSYWAFYSMWFYQQVKNAECYMVEPERKNMEVGRRNFALNGFKGYFSTGKIPNFKVDVWMKDRDKLDILHADTQGFELTLLKDARESLLQKKIRFVFVSGHSQELHHDCIDYLNECGYNIIADADFDYESNCLDSVIVAQSEPVIPYINIKGE